MSKDTGSDAISVLSASVDWVTVSGKSEQIYGLQSALDVMISHYHESGERSYPTARHGYSGWAIGPIRYLDNGEYGYVQASGDAAGHVASVAGGYDLRCTRIDCQLTIVCGPDISGRPIGDRVYDGATANNRCASPTKIQSPAGGYTVYIGSRASDRFGRVYRKDAEDKDGGWPRHTWRYEVEIKKPRSQKVWRALLNVPREARQAAIIGYVADYYQARGLYCPVDPQGDYTIDDTLTRKQTPTERKLRWLADAVSPTVLQLIEMGLADDVLKAFGVGSSEIIGSAINDALKSLLNK